MLQGVDYVKIDACRGPGYNSSRDSWTLFRQGVTECAARRAAPMFMSVESCSTIHVNRHDIAAIWVAFFSR